ncbi:MAG: hypothetical protein AAF710_00075 [Planctomycetota bacterium]
MLLKSFIDLAFILLCAAVVLLAQSVRVGVIDTDPAEVQGSQLADLPPQTTRVVVIGPDELFLEDQPMPSIDTLLDQTGSDTALMLTPQSEAVSHHRVMLVWSGLSAAGRIVKIAAVASPGGGGGARP